jgi:hypothetical protein
MVSDPFADPPVMRAQSILEKAGIATVYSNASAPYTKTSAAALAADADKVRAANPQIVLIGSVDVPTIAAFINAFKRLRFSPNRQKESPSYGQFRIASRSALQRIQVHDWICRSANGT